MGPVGEPLQDGLPGGADQGQLLFQPPRPLPQGLTLAPGGVRVAAPQGGELLLLGVGLVQLALQAAPLGVQLQPAVEVCPRRVDPAQADHLPQALRVLPDRA